MMHSNPFSSTGYDIADLTRKMEQKVDKHELYSINSTLDRLESALREARSEINELRSRCEGLENNERQRNEI